MRRLIPALLLGVTIVPHLYPALMPKPEHSNSFFTAPAPYFCRSIEEEARMLEPHYIALPAFTVGVFRGVLLGTARIG